MELAAALREAGGRGRPAPIAAAAAAAAVIALRADAEPLALYCCRRRAGQDPRLADAAAAPRRRALVRRASGDGRRPRPGEAGWGKLVALGYARAALAALDLAQDLSRRAARLADAAPKLRAKGKRRRDRGAALPTTRSPPRRPWRILSDRAGRRLFDRLVALGAARELTGRPTFRLYGL